MKNLICTIPKKGDLRHWHNVEPMLEGCVDEENFWTFSCGNFPKESGPGALCFIVHSGFVRGYFTILEFSEEPVWRTTDKAEEIEYKAGKKVKLVTWRRLEKPIEHVGFQSFWYTELRP